jgi:hypothetical protein
MRVLSRTVAALIGLMLLVFAGAAFADDDGSNAAPAVVALEATNVGSTGALLRGEINPKGRATTYVFEYGTTTAYGLQTASASSVSSSWELVSARVDGLQPGTTYHYRLVATNSKATKLASDRTFTTLAASEDEDESLRPQLGTSVAVKPGRGEVRVRLPGTSSFVPLRYGSELPVGSVLDARRGAVALTAALPSGQTQTGHFGGGRLLIRQNRRGLVDLHLRGRFCSRSAGTRRTAQGSAVVHAARRARSGRRLWGRDRGGRFRTHGKHSHATVRGTRWLVEDRCDGTLTRVTAGSVVVRDTVRGKRVIVRAGERYLARPRR